MIFTSPYPRVVVPEIDFTSFVLARAEQLGNKPALVDSLSGQSITYADLYDKILRVAAGLRTCGLGKGDVLALLLPNLSEFAIAFHAAAVLGAAVTTVNPLWNKDELCHQLLDSGADFLITVPELKAKIDDPDLKARLKAIFIIGGESVSDSFEHLYDHPRLESIPKIDPINDLVALPYSSGTTGTSKGVMLTHYNLVANLCQMEVTEHIRDSDVLLCVLPLFHIYGLVVILNMGLHAGATIVMMTHFDIEHMLDAIEKHKVTFAHLVPPIVLALARQARIDHRNLSTLRAIMSAAAPLSADLAGDCSAKLGCIVKQGWGMTETSPAVTMAEPVPGRTRDGSVGRPVPNTEIKVIDLETGDELGIDQHGELLVRGPQVMKGYLNRPEATAQMIDADGWLRTGDIGYADSEGFFFIVDRAKELIKYKGFQVAPAELEAILLTHPCVADAAVIPLPDEEAGEIPKAFIVLKEIATEQELMEYVSNRVARYKRVRVIEFIEQIPKSASGKILRRTLVARERAKLV